jgi:hypothetical protein
MVVIDPCCYPATAHKIIATSPEQWQRDGEEIAHSAVDEVGRIGAVVNAGVAWTSPSNRRRRRRGRRSSSRSTASRQHGERRVLGDGVIGRWQWRHDGTRSRRCSTWAQPRPAAASGICTTNGSQPELLRSGVGAGATSGQNPRRSRVWGQIVEALGEASEVGTQWVRVVKREPMRNASRWSEAAGDQPEPGGGGDIVWVGESCV